MNSCMLAYKVSLLYLCAGNGSFNYITWIIRSEPDSRPTSSRNTDCISLGRINQVEFSWVFFGIEVSNPTPNERGEIRPRED